MRPSGWRDQVTGTAVGGVRGRRRGRLSLLVVFVAVFAAIVTMAGGSASAQGEEVAATTGSGASIPSDTRELIESNMADQAAEGAETDLHAAQTMPHRNLGPDAALELAEAVFGPELEGTAGIYGELKPDKFLSNYAAIVPVSSLPEDGGKPSEALAADHPNQPVLLESSLPLRTENESGETETVDLELEHSEGELQPAAPLAEVGIPQELGEGISLAGPEIELAVAGAPAGVPATDAEGQFAFYPEVAEDTDLIVAPIPQGVETLTDVRSAEAPLQTTYDLGLPPGAELRPTNFGGAEVIEGGQTTLLIPPPTAIDAAGHPVQTELSVSGDSLTVAIKPDPSASFPVLVDPGFLYENTDWAFGHASMAGWTSGTTNPSATLPVPYWIWNSAYPGLDLSWGFGGNAHNGDTSSWSYTVPRYGEDASVGKTPSTWIYVWTAEDIFFSKEGNNAGWPALIWGITSPSGWVNDRVHTGSEAEWNTWHNGETIVNEGSNRSAKSALMAMMTGEEEDPAKRRDSYIGASYMVLVDENAPTMIELVGPTRWVNTTTEPITYAVEDAGLGVKSAWASYEANPEPGWGFELPCAGTNASPCPRIARSGTAGKDETQVALHYDPTALPTGKDRVIFAFGDPLAGTAGSGEHAAGGIVELKIDHTAPEVTLSGALTEEEELGTLQSEYPLNIKATDGTEADPQSGVAKVEVKVDGKARQTWNPGCATEDCSFTGAWTLKTSEYTAASHEVEVLVTDAAGVVSESTIEIDLGEAPPQTSFTSPHPSFEASELSSISFKATRGGAPVAGATFRCSLDEGETPTKSCSSPFELPQHPGPGPHIFSVAAVDSGGKVDPTPARWKFEIGAYPAAPSPSEKLVYPETGKTTASYYTLEAEWGGNPEGKAAEGVTGITFEMELPGWESFKPVPEGCVTDGEGRQISWPLRPQGHPGHNKPVYLKVRGCPVFEEAKYPEKEIEFRAVFDGGAKVAGASAAAATEFVYNANTTRVPTDAVEEVGPASVDLLTGAFTLSRTDVSIPVPGFEANLEFTRVYHSSADGRLPGTSLVLGGAWQPSSPLESEGEGEAWTRIEEKEIPYHPAIPGHECWLENEQQVCEEWVEEEEQPRIQWIELFDNEGAGVPFEIAGESYVAPEWAKEMKLYKEAGNFVLADPNGTHTTFVSDGEGHFVPKYISYQATPGSTRIVYEPLSGGKGLRLVKEIAPAFVTCPEAASHLTPGCRTLTFNYGVHNLAGGGSVTLLESLAYWGPTGNPEEARLVATYGYTEMASPSGGPGIALTSETEPRAGLTEQYTYAATPYSNDLASMTPPGLEPWKFNYEFNAPGYPSQGERPTRLKSVSRGGATTTIAYEVPVKGTGAPYDMSSDSIAGWGQSDLPVDAIAIFPPNHVPSGSPPSSYTGATVHYMDPEGHQVNVASPSPPGVSGASIATTETDMKGNVVRELSAQNRLRALEASEPVARSHELDTHSVYNQKGTELLESWGPLHEVRLESGEIVQARRHTITRYDEGEPLPPAGTPPAYLPTRETVAAVVPGKEGELEPQVTETHYDWPLRVPEETIVDPGGLNIRSVTKYNAAGQVTETRQPQGASGGTAGTTKTIYWTAGTNSENASCGNKPAWAGLPCVSYPVAEPSPAEANPKLPWTWFTEYSTLDQPKEIQQKTNGILKRATTITYDSAGRQIREKQTGEGIHLPATETLYSSATGRPYQSRFGQQLTTPEQLTGLPTINVFDGGSASLANFNSSWSTLGWAGGTTPKGSDTTTGWRPVDAYSTVNGTYYNQAISDAGSGLAAVATMAVNPGGTSRYFSIWLDTPTPSGVRGGYQLRFTDTSTNIYEVKLSKWVGGTQTVLASKSSYSFANGNSFALVDQGGTVSAWTDTGAGFTQLLSAADSSFSGGNAALEGSGNITRLTNFRAGSFSSFSGPITTTYDKLGRPVEYEDADGNVSEVRYDLLGRPVLVTDGKGYQTVSYDKTSGVATEMTDSAAGTFKATYNADGQMTEQLLPDGLDQRISYDPAGTAVSLSYEKQIYCSSACTWLSFSREDSVGGQVLREESTLGTHEYSYDKAGRLTLAKEFGLGGFCTTRSYAFDKDSNRTRRIAREPKENGACDTESEGSRTSYGYDTADRLIGEGVEYDNLGRITSLPAKYSGGGTLSSSYYVNDLTRSQTQGEVTNTYNLDPALRERERVRTGGGEAGTEIYHYTGGSDSPAWTQEGEAWSRSIGALGGGLGAIQKSNGEVTLQLANMHGDVVASASIKPEETKLLSTQSFDEFGNPAQGNPLEGGSAEYGWLGIKGRRTQLPSGVIQMGVRSYVPAMGRFISTDPVPGGSANAYDYTNVDPVNGLDLGGRKPGDKECLPGIVGCKCVMWAKFQKRGRGRLRLTTVRKCNIFGGITRTGLESQWGKGKGSGFDGIEAPAPVYPEARPVCPSTNKCTSYEKHSVTVHCTPGREYQFEQSWGFSIHLDEPGIEHQLYVKIQQWCPK